MEGSRFRPDIGCCGSRCCGLRVPGSKDLGFQIYNDLAWDSLFFLGFGDIGDPGVVDWS